MAFPFMMMMMAVVVEAAAGKEVARAAAHAAPSGALGLPGYPPAQKRYRF